METTKVVRIYKNGDLLKKFECKRAEFTPGGVTFQGVPSKDGTREFIVYHRGNIFYDIDHDKREAIVNFLDEVPGSIIYARITW